MHDLTVAAIQMDSLVGQVDRNLAHAAELVGDASAQGAQLVALPELFGTGYEYTDRNFRLAEPLDGLTGSWIVETARRLGVHLVGSFPAQVGGKAYIVAMLASPDGRQWVYRKNHVALWENLYYEQGSEPVIADTELGRIGLLICWDQVFSDLARAYQGCVDLLCIPSSPPTWLGAMEDSEGQELAQLDSLRSLGNTMDGVEWFDRAQVAHAQSAGVPVVYAARCGEFHSPIPYGWSFLTMLKPRQAWRVLRAVGTRYLLRCPMHGRSRILDAQGQTAIGAGQDGEAVLVATVRSGAPDPSTLPALPNTRALISGIPRSMLLFDDSLAVQGRWYRQRRASGN